MNIINTVPRDQIPVGFVVALPDDNIPDGWIPADGQIVSQQEYPMLFEVIGTSFNRRYQVTMRRHWWEFWKPKSKLIFEDVPGLFRLPDLRHIDLENRNDVTQSS